MASNLPSKKELLKQEIYFLVKTVEEVNEIVKLLENAEGRPLPMFPNSQVWAVAKGVIGYRRGQMVFDSIMAFAHRNFTKYSINQLRSIVNGNTLTGYNCVPFRYDPTSGLSYPSTNDPLYCSCDSPELIKNAAAGVMFDYCKKCKKEYKKSDTNKKGISPKPLFADDDLPF